MSESARKPATKTRVPARGMSVAATTPAAAEDVAASRLRAVSPELMARFEFDAIVKEFDTLRAEVSARIQKQQDITNFSIALAGGFAALSGIVLRPIGTALSPSYHFVYPAISILLSAFALMTLDHEANIVLIYRYADVELRPRLRSLLGSSSVPIWRWNECRATWQHHSGGTNLFYYAMSWAKYAITVLPSIALVVVYGRHYSDPPPLWEWILFLASISLLVIVFLSAVFVGLRYQEMGRPPSIKSDRDLGSRV